MRDIAILRKDMFKVLRKNKKYHSTIIPYEFLGVPYIVVYSNLKDC